MRKDQKLGLCTFMIDFKQLWKDSAALFVQCSKEKTDIFCGPILESQNLLTYLVSCLIFSVVVALKSNCVCKRRSAVGEIKSAGRWGRLMTFLTKLWNGGLSSYSFVSPVFWTFRQMHWV